MELSDLIQSLPTDKHLCYSFKTFPELQIPRVGLEPWENSFHPPFKDNIQNIEKVVFSPLLFKWKK